MTTIKVRVDQLHPEALSALRLLALKPRTAKQVATLEGITIQKATVALKRLVTDRFATFDDQIHLYTITTRGRNWLAHTP